MKVRLLNDLLKKGMGLYVEHLGVKHFALLPDTDFITIAYIAYGEGMVIVENDRYEVKSGDIFVINQGTISEFLTEKSYSEGNSFEIHFILFEREYLNGVWESYDEEFASLEGFFTDNARGYIRVTDSDTLEIRNAIVRLINEYYENAPARDSAILGNLLALIPIILRRHNVNEKYVFSKNPLVDETIRQIRNNIYHNPKPSEIAAHRFVTTEHLGRVFKQETGMTMTQYINNLRVEITKDILQNTDRPIGNIPVLFNIKMKYLQQIFRKYTGMSMREYRSQRHYR